MADDVQRLKADELLQEIGRNVFWLNPNFFEVIKHEDSSIVEGVSGSPHSDNEFAASWVQLILNKSASHALGGSQNVFSVIRSLSGIPEQFDALAEIIIKRIEWLRRDVQNKKTMRAALKIAPKGHPLSRGTRLIARELIGRFLKDKLLRITRNNAIDLSHAVVSVSYCDYVLLDGQWAAMVNDSRKRIANASVPIPVAKVFSKKANGIEEFLRDLESSADRL